MIPFIGVRISCDILVRKTVFARFAACALSCSGGDGVSNERERCVSAADCKNSNVVVRRTAAIRRWKGAPILDLERPCDVRGLV
jgi:hypothetical protein